MPPKKKGGRANRGDGSDEDIPSLLNNVDADDVENDSIVTSKKSNKKGKNAPKAKAEAPAEKGVFFHR